MMAGSFSLTFSLKGWEQSDMVRYFSTDLLRVLYR